MTQRHLKDNVSKTTLSQRPSINKSPHVNWVTTLENE